MVGKKTWNECAVYMPDIKFCVNLSGWEWFGNELARICYHSEFRNVDRHTHIPRYEGKRNISAEEIYL